MNKRLLQLTIPPILALLGAAVYLNHRLAQAESAVAEFCATVVAGMPARIFIERALEADLEVHDYGAESSTLIASRTVFAWRKEIFECRAERDDAGRVRGARFARRAE